MPSIDRHNTFLSEQIGLWRVVWVQRPYNSILDKPMCVKQCHVWRQNFAKVLANFQCSWNIKLFKPRKSWVFWPDYYPLKLEQHSCYYLKCPLAQVCYVKVQHPSKYCFREFFDEENLINVRLEIWKFYKQHEEAPLNCTFN